jgi:putative ABC transport system permease protein
MGIPLLRGRAFTDQDTATSEPVAMIDENLAKQYFPNEDPIGKRIRRTLLNAPWTTIVGIVGHVKHSDLAADSGMGSHYYPVYQTPQVTTFTVIARTTLETASLSNAIRDAVRATDPAQSVFELRTMEERVLSSLGTRRLAVQLMALFASVGVFMAAIGLYGVVSYVVAQRTHEIGIRMALGAHRNQILALVVRHGMRMTFAGVTLGSIGAFILARSLSSQLFEVRPFDPATFVLMATTVLMITLLACIIPARRATAVDPLEACRHD